jgi:hypothetical protein
VTAAQREDRQAAEIRRLRKLVIDQGEAVTTLTRRQQALERMLGLQRKGGAGTPAPEPELDPYAQAAAVQARRRSLRLAGGTAVGR